MWKKVFTQITLVFLVIFIILYTYKTYFKNKDSIKINQINNSQKKTVIDSKDKQLEQIDESSNLVQNLKYVSKDILGNEYIISSKSSELSLDGIDIINMNDVNAKITMINKDPLFITSKYAIYNNENYETTFVNNVVITYLDNIITSEKLTVSIVNNFAKVSEEVIYQNTNVKLEADIIEIDLITKNSKIFMIDKKIKITNK